MSRKVIFIVLVLLVLGGGGLAVFIFLSPKNNPITQLTASPEGTAKSLVDDLIANKPNEAYDRLTEKLKTDYSEDYWKKSFFPRFAGYAEQPKVVKDEEVKGSATQPSPYTEQVQARRLIYQFIFENLPYNLEIVVVKTSNDTWKVNELAGKFQVQQ